MAVISKGIKLSYKNGEASSFVELTNLYEIPELGGDVDKIEVTTLASEAHEYTNGIKNYGDSIAFKFYYEKTQFTTLNGLDAECEWKVELPDATAYTFSGIPSVKLDGVSYNAALTYSLNIAPTSAMVVA
jgi:hypothetical protein